MKPAVLVLDDSLTVRMDLTEAFESAGFAVHPCGDLAAARKLLASQHLDLAVLDVLLPDGDGVDLLREIRAAPATAHLPVFLLSTRAEVSDRVRGMRTGADDYLGKPYDVAHVIARARQAIPADEPGARSAPMVLVVDDSETCRDELRAVLSAAGYGVTLAATGEDGLRAASDLRPAAVIVDGSLGAGIDGTTVVRRIKQDAALRTVPCLLLTASLQRADEVRALEAGADAYLRKEAGTELVLARLAALLRTSGESESASAALLRRAGDAAAASLLAPKRVLAVDDSPTYLDLLSEALRGEGYEVVTAASGEEALALLEVQKVDAILLDLMMPGLSGEETCRRVKAVAALRGVPLLMLTALDEQKAMIAGINAGADDYISKSADFEVLHARLRAQLRRRQFEDEHRRIRDEMLRTEQEARFLRLFRSSILGLVMGGARGPTDANDAFLDMVGAARAELAAGRLTWMGLTPEEWRPVARRAMDELVATGKAGPWEQELVRADGTRVPVLVGLAATEGGTGVGFLLDRTEAKVAERRLRETAAALEQVNRELEAARDRAERESRFKSRFLASMSHELRTPLNAIIGFSELLAERIPGPLEPTQAEYVDNVLQSGRHLLTLVNDILDLSKIEAGRMELHRERTTLGAVVDAVQGVAAALAARKKLLLEVRLEPGLPELDVDPLRVKQVLFNLVSNAVKFTPAGGRVRLGARAEDGWVCVEVEDSGIGIRAEDLPRLFREFEQIEPETGDKPEGTGLGLALVQRFVHMHGGSVEVRSEPGKGSVFSVRLPGAAATAAADSAVRL